MATPPMPTVYGLSMSPWTQRADWALQAQKVPFRFVPSSNFGVDWYLKVKLLRWRITYPTMLTPDSGALADSNAIARYADAHRAEGLPALTDREGIQEWIAGAEIAMSNQRTRMISVMMQADELCAGMVPKPMRWLPGQGVFLVKMTMSGLMQKYPSQGDLEAPRQFFAKLRKALNGATSDTYVLGEFSFADIVAAIALQMVQPAPQDAIKLPHGFRKAMAVAGEPLAQEFPDLLQWRDWLLKEKGYSNHHLCS